MKKLTSLGIGMGLILACTVGPVSAQYSPYTYPGQVGVIGAFGLVDNILNEYTPVTIPGSPPQDQLSPPTQPSGSQQPLPAHAPNDLDGNGRADVLLHNTVTGEVTAWLIDANNEIRTVFIATRVPPDTIKAVADFNGDGRADILRHDSTTGEVAMWLMNADGTAQDVPITFGGNPVKIAPGWQFVVVLDFNGDGQADIFWRLCRQIDVWFMNGATIVNSGSITDVPLQLQLVPGPSVDPLACPSG